MDLSSVFLAALGIGLLIFLHELGHFAAARAAGVRVEVFSLGFGPRLFGRNLGGTDFRVSLVPFGGYVMVAGQDPSDDRYPAAQSLWSKSVGQRALFWSGGVVMNVLFALVVFPLVFRAGVAFTAPLIGAVAHGSPAWEAGLQPGDRIVAIGSKPMYSFENLGIEVALHGPRPMQMTVRDAGGAERVVTVTPRYSAQEGLSTLGVSPKSAEQQPTIEVTAGGAAATAGLRSGDVLQSLAGQAVGPDSLAAALTTAANDASGTIEVTVERAGERLSKQIAGKPMTKVPLLIGVVPLPRQVVGLRSGVPLIDRLDLRRGDVLLGIDGQPFLAGDLEALRSGPPELRLHVARGDARITLQQTVTSAEREALADSVALAADDSLMLAPQPDGAALAAGLRAGDRVAQVDGKPVHDWEELKEAVQSGTGAPLRLTLSRPATSIPETFWDAADQAADAGILPGDSLDLEITPRRPVAFDYGFSTGLPYVREEVRAEDFGHALKLGTVCSLDLIKQLYVTLKRLVTGDVGAKNLGGIIRISQVSYDAAQRGPSWFWYFLALLSLNLAFVNLLPIPVLDGGHLLFLLIEKVKGSPVSPRVFGYSQVVGLVFVLLLVLFVTYNDILRLL
ncbi:MAG: RIP metalloprotease RseP [Planctomycetes bacterium]|nr:RIP metalloprotease RseP [Planctomycetota bacterium]